MKKTVAVVKRQVLYKCKWGLMALIVFAMAAAGCSDLSSEQEAKKAVSTGGNEQESRSGDEEKGTEKAQGAEDADQTDEETETADVSEKAQIEEQVLLEQDGVKITLKELDADGFMGPELKLLIENNSDQNLTVQTHDTSVNGIMVETLFSCEVAAGKSANEGIAFMSSDLDEAQINVLQNFEFGFHIINTESWDTVFDSEVITVSTNLDGSEEQVVDDSGVLLLDQDNVKITVKEVDDKNSFWGADIYIYVENNTDKSISVQASSVSIDGFMVEPYFSCEVAAGKKSYDTITFMEEELKENNIESIDNMEVSFSVSDAESYETILETEPLKVEFESADTDNQ